MKYRTLKKIPQLNNEIGDIVDMGGDEKEIAEGVKNGFLELCEDQTVKNKHVWFLATEQNIKLKVLQPN